MECEQDRRCINCGGYESDFAPVVLPVKTLIPLGGHDLKLKFKDLRAHRRNNCARTVWVCGSACDLQTRAIAAMGLPTHRWPMTLVEFTKQELKRLRGGLNTAFVTKTSDNPLCLQGSQDGENGKDEEMTPYPQEHVQGPTAVKSGLRKGGRPRVENPLSPAQRMRAYRQRISQTPTQAAAE